MKQSIGKKRWCHVRSLFSGSFSNTTTAIVIASGGLTSAGANAAVPKPGDLLVADSDNGYGAGKILEINPATGAQTVLASGGYLDQPTGIALDGLGNLVVSDFENGSTSTVFRINLVTGQQTLVASGGPLIGTAGLSIERSGSYIAMNQDSIQYPPSPSFSRINATTGTQTGILYASAFGGSPISFPDSFILDSSGNILCSNSRTADGTTGIFKVDSQTGAVTTISTGGAFNSVGPDGIAANPANSQNVLVTCPDYANSALSNLVNVNLATGQQTGVVTGGEPTAINSDASGDIFLANNYGGTPGTPAASIVELNPLTGQETIISTGGSLLTPMAILSVPVPEPVGVAAFGLIGGVLLGRRRRGS